MRKAVVTGATGYIGSVLCKMLKEQGYYVLGIDYNQQSPNINKVKKYCDKLIINDFSKDEVLAEIPKYATIFHLAASSLLGPSAERPIDYYFNNTVKSLRLIEHAVDHGHVFIFASTAAVYSEKQKKTAAWKNLYGTDDLEQMRSPVREDGIIAPPNNYGMSKLMTENMLDSITEAQNNGKRKWPLIAMSFRFFNVIGAYGDVGPNMYTPHIISSLIRAKKNPLTYEFKLNGNDFKTPDGTCIRDYVDVKDVCRALIHADMSYGKWPSRMHKDCKFNLGTGKGYSNKQILDTFKKVTSPHFEGESFYYSIGERRVGDPPYLVADPSKFIEVSNFYYKYSHDLETMISDAWSYHNGV